MKVLIKARIPNLWLLTKVETQSKISKRFIWYLIYKGVESYIMPCENCQKQYDLKLKTTSKLHSIPVSSNVIRQVGVDLCGLPDVDGYSYLVKVLKENPLKWPSIIEGVLFAHRVSKHSSAKYSSFKLL